ncbi:MAG: hypothetical protein QJR05_04525 [Thermoanaerobacterium sp.]|nr:hypothetical protein [Thermoanaerobacterium sp.]
MVVLAWILGIVFFIIFSMMHYSVSSFGSLVILGVVIGGYFLLMPYISVEMVKQYEPLFAAFNTSVILGLVFGRMAAAGERMEKIQRKVDKWLDE